jgi:hypothetical protein
VIPLKEPHLRRLIGEYVKYHHEDRIHDSLDKMLRIDVQWKVDLLQAPR